MGLAAAEVTNGRLALAWLANHPAPSLILLDLMMPEMDGFEFLRELRQRPAFLDVPVIVVTAKELTAEDVRVLSGQTAQAARAASSSAGTRVTAFMLICPGD